MKFTTNSSGEQFTILAADHYIAIPINITETTLVKAGTPIKGGGTIAKDSSTGAAKVADAIGVLLYDVDPAVNPNGALLIHGVVDGTKAQSHSGFALTGITDYVPGITLRTNLGTNT